MIPKNITKDHIKRAISEVKTSEIPAARKEKHYQLIYEGSSFPTKYIISIANKYANGNELSSHEFVAGEAKNFLLKLGFEVIDKRLSGKESTQKFWIEKTIVNNRTDRIKGSRALGKALWSPQKDKRGADIYKNMREVNEGDIVLHLIDNFEFSGVSLVQSRAISANGLVGTDWEGPSYLIELKNYTELSPKIKRNDLLDFKYKELLDSIKEKSEVFYNTNLDLRQGAYLTPCPIELLWLINKIYKEKSNKNIPHIKSPIELKEQKKDTGLFNKRSFENNLPDTGLVYSKLLTKRFVASLLTKPFVILTGLSGSGKTKLAQAFVQWICASEDQYKIIPVGADWTNREPLLGYPNGLQDKKYVLPDSGALQLVMEASKPENRDKPYFMILDEMNLSHVEYYFADFLSIMESRDKIKLYSGNKRKDSMEEDVDQEIGWPENLFIIGTVNIDETTYMFSPKVLDRANVIEFRIEHSEMEGFLEKNNHLDMDALFIEGNKEKGGLGQYMASDFLSLANKQDVKQGTGLEILNSFFKELQDVGAEFGYRSAGEIQQLIHQLGVLDNDMKDDDKIDIAIMQKLLPKLHGSRKKLVGPLETLAGLCLKKKTDADKHISAKDAYRQYVENKNNNGDREVIYPISFAKIERMIKNAIDNGFTSYAEA